MITVYICNSMEDITAFVRMFPESRLSNYQLLGTNNDFNLRKSPPLALYKRPDTVMVTWSTVHDAENYLQFGSSDYTLGKLQPLLDLTTVFVTFLKHSNAYDKYIDNFDPDCSDNTNLQASKLISRAFYWDASSEAYHYWQTLHSKWEELLKHFGIDPTTVLTDVLTTVKEYE